MTDFAEARDEVISLLREYGSPVTIQRRATTYDPATRLRSAGTAFSQTVYGLLESPAKGNARFANSETKTFERTITLSPDGMQFDPEIGDIVTADGRNWRIEGGLNITRQGGLLISVSAGLISA